MQTIVEKSVAKSGIVAVCVASKAGAEKALQTSKFDLLILGAAFGGSIGSSALREVCEVCRGKGIPVLALTIDQIADAEASGIDAIVTIQIVPDKLARSVRQLIARTGRSTDAPNPESRATPARELPELSPEPLDARRSRELGSHDFMRDIVAQYVADAALVLASLAAAVAERDQKAFREQAHALRSCAANVGAQNVYRMCLAWRDLDAQEIAASGAQCMKMLEKEFERVRAALTPMLQDDGGSGPSSEAA